MLAARQGGLTLVCVSARLEVRVQCKARVTSAHGTTVAMTTLVSTSAITVRTAVNHLHGNPIARLAVQASLIALLTRAREGARCVGTNLTAAAIVILTLVYVFTLLAVIQQSISGVAVTHGPSSIVRTAVSTTSIGLTTRVNHVTRLAVLAQSEASPAATDNSCAVARTYLTASAVLLGAKRTHFRRSRFTSFAISQKFLTGWTLACETARCVDTAVGTTAYTSRTFVYVCTLEPVVAQPVS